MISILERRKLKNKVGIIFVSKADTDVKRVMTQYAIDTAREFGGDNEITIIVAESIRGVEYKDAEVFYHDVEPFNYNKVLNLSRGKLKDKDFILFCNNDLVFTENWLDNLLENKGLCLSPKEPTDGRQSNITEDTKGYGVARHFSGWCFGLRKKALQEIKSFNEDYPFWFADNVVVDELKKLKIEPVLVVKSIVKHLGSQTLQDLEKEKKNKITFSEVARYEQETGELTELSLKEIGRSREGRLLANKMLPKI